MEPKENAADMGLPINHILDPICFFESEQSMATVPPVVERSLLSRSLRAAAWGYMGTALKLVMQLSVQIILARLLGPSEYGLFAVGVMVVSFAQYFSDIGSSALIPLRTIQSEGIRFAFTWQMIVSVIIAAMLALLAGPISLFVNEPRAEWVVRVLGLVCVFNAMGGVALALLRRELDFKTIQVGQVLGYFVGYVLLALPYAFFVGPSVMALIIAWLSQVIVTSAIYLHRAPHSMRPCFTCEGSRDLVNFGAHSLVANLGTWALSNADRMIVARSFPIAQVGLYSTSANLLSTPLSQIYATFQQVMFSASSKMTQDKSTGRIFGAMVALVIVFGGLCYVFSYCTADTIVALLYGEKWKDAVPFVKAFSVTMLFHAISGVVTPMLWAHGAIRKDAVVQATMAAAVAIGAILLVHWSAVAVAWWVAGVFGVRAVILIIVGSRIFPGTKGLLFESIIKGLIFLCLSGASIHEVNSVLSTIVTVPVRFLADVAILALCALLAVRFRQSMGQTFAESIEFVASKLSVRMRKFLLLH